LELEPTNGFFSQELAKIAEQNFSAPVFAFSLSSSGLRFLCSLL